jgi:hypothetical protein
MAQWNQHLVLDHPVAQHGQHHRHVPCSSQESFHQIGRVRSQKMSVSTAGEGVALRAELYAARRAAGNLQKDLDSVRETSSNSKEVTLHAMLVSLVTDILMHGGRSLRSATAWQLS